jgi:hypothetical protein
MAGRLPRAWPGGWPGLPAMVTTEMGGRGAINVQPDP